MSYKSIKNDPLRPLLSEVTPYEMPLPFSIQNLYSFLRRIEFKWVTFRSFSVNRYKLHQDDRNYLEIMFEDWRVVDTKIQGKQLKFNLRENFQMTNPHKFYVRRNNGKLRELHLLHPVSMLLVSEFVNRNETSLLYFTNKSRFSLRHPKQVARVKKIPSYIKEYRPTIMGNLEIVGEETNYVQSYFSYPEHSRIYKFYESDVYLELESQYQYQGKMDISNCFPSIYTHSVSWATNGWAVSKNNFLDKSLAKTFGNRFDSLMQNLNFKETNGIVVGPEISRIFAEVILQQIDRDVDAECIKYNMVFGKNYVVKRFVDDYFIYTNVAEDFEKISDFIDMKLSKYKMQTNISKKELTKMPLGDEIGGAKNKLKQIIHNKIWIEFDENASGKYIKSFVKKRDILLDIKKIYSSDCVKPADVTNYLLSRIIVKINHFTKLSLKFDANVNNISPLRFYEDIVEIYIQILDIAVYLHSLSNSYSHSLKLVKIIIDLLESISKITDNSGYYSNHFSSYAANRIKNILLSTRNKGNFGTHNLVLLDCLTFLKENLSEKDIKEILSIREQEISDLEFLSLSIILRHTINVNKLSLFQDEVLGAMKLIIDNPLANPENATQGVWLRIILLDIRGKIYSNRYFINNKGFIIDKSSIQDNSDYSSPEQSAPRFFNINVDDNYSYLLALKGTSSVY